MMTIKRWASGTSTRSLTRHLSTLNRNQPANTRSTQQPQANELDASQIKPQFTYQPIRPSPQSDTLTFLPPARFILTIISLSYNRPSVHSLLSPNFPTSKSIRFKDPAGHFILTAIHHEFLNLKTPIPSYISTLNSCFSQKDRELWKVKRIERNNSKKKPCFQLRLTFSLRIKELHKSSVIRKGIRKRWIAALKLIVQYGAHIDPSVGSQLNINSNSPPPSSQPNPSSHDLIQLNRFDSGFDRWLDKNYYYIVHPNLSLHTVGLVELIGSIRLALETLKRQMQINSNSNININKINSYMHSKNNVKNLSNSSHSSFRGNHKKLG